jgi:hypothetical protein
MIAWHELRSPIRFSTFPLPIGITSDRGSWADFRDSCEFQQSDPTPLDWARSGGQVSLWDGHDRAQEIVHLVRFDAAIAPLLDKPAWRAA